MNPHEPQRTSPRYLMASLIKHRDLIAQMAWRDIAGRYRGSMMGLIWAIVNPIIMLSVYTFVFSIVFEAKWGVQGENGKADFALILFSGLILHGLLAEILAKGPMLITGNVNYVKKVVFPLEILAVTSVLAAVFHALISLSVLLTALALLKGFLHWTVITLPFVVAPLIVLSIGFAWFLASLGVFIRDMAQATGIIATILLFVSPIFFPKASIPEPFQPYLNINPLTFVIEQARQVLIWGQTPDWSGLFIYTLISLIFSWLGFIWFQKTRKGFADVL